jgi:hypothetical protein
MISLIFDTFCEKVDLMAGNLGQNNKNKNKAG